MSKSKLSFSIANSTIVQATAKAIRSSKTRMGLILAVFLANHGVPKLVTLGDFLERRGVARKNRLLAKHTATCISIAKLREARADMLEARGRFLAYQARKAQLKKLDDLLAQAQARKVDVSRAVAAAEVAQVVVDEAKAEHKRASKAYGDAIRTAAQSVQYEHKTVPVQPFA